MLINLFSLHTYCQNTVGLINLDAKKTLDGYTFVNPINVSNHYLINNCGEIINEWLDPNFVSGAASYLLKNGDIIKSKRSRDNSKDSIFAPGAGAIIEIRDWNNSLKWSYTLNNQQERLHHDFKVMPNGNLLLLVWELKSKMECIQAGRDTLTIPNSGIYNEKIIEIDTATKSIIWQWSAWDHLIQDYDSSKSNYGVLKDNPQRININSNKNGFTGLPLADWMHINSIDFNPELNQILISAPTFGEIYIIDHSTTTAQAKTSSGGQSKKGGDLMYRWGNEINYITSNPAPQKLFFQHDARWILNVATSHPDYGKVSIFNNRFKADQSLPSVFSTPWDMYSNSYLENNKRYGPIDIDKSFVTDKAKQQSPMTSSIQYLPNGNILLLAGVKGYIYELAPNNQVVWEYILPYKGVNRVSQGTKLVNQDNTIFNTYKYPKNYEAFKGKNLEPKGYLEINPNLELCSKLTTTNSVLSNRFKIYPNPIVEALYVEVENNDIVIIYDNYGRIIKKKELMKGVNYINFELNSGIYTIELSSTKQRMRFVK